MSDMFKIVDMDGFAQHVIKCAAKEMEIANTDEVFEYITANEVSNLIVENCSDVDENDDILIDAEHFNNCLTAVIQRIQNSAVAQLASEGYLDCAWDDELNDMVFWLSDKGQEYNNLHS